MTFGGAVDVRRDERVMVVAPPRKGELAGGKTTDGAGDDAAAGDRGRVATCEQADPPAVDEGLVGLVDTGDLGADDRGAAVAVVDGQPVVAQRTGALGEGEEGLLQKIVEVDGPPIGKTMPVAHCHEAGLFDHHRPSVAAGLGKGQPHERDIACPVREPCGRVGPADLAEGDGHLRMLQAEPRVGATMLDLAESADLRFTAGPIPRGVRQGHGWRR